MAVMHGARGASLGLANAASRAQSQRDSERKIDPTASLRAFRTPARVTSYPSTASSVRSAPTTSRRFSLNAKYDKLVGNAHGMRTGLGRKPQQQRPVEGGVRGDAEVLAQLGLGLADGEDGEGERGKEGEGAMSYADAKRKYSLSGHALESKSKEEELAPEWLHKILYPPPKPPASPIIPQPLIQQSGPLGSWPVSMVPSLSHPGTMNGSLASSLQQMQLGPVNHGQVLMPPTHGLWQAAGLGGLISYPLQTTGHSSSAARLSDLSAARGAQSSAAIFHGIQSPPQNPWQLAGASPHPIQIAKNSAPPPPIPSAPILRVASPPEATIQLRGILSQASLPEPQANRQSSKAPGIAVHRVRFLPVQQMYSPPLLTSSASGASHTFSDTDQQHAYVLQAGGTPTGPYPFADADGSGSYIPHSQALTSASSLPDSTPQNKIRPKDLPTMPQQQPQEPPVKIQPTLKRSFSHTDLPADLTLAKPSIPSALIQAHAEIVAEAPSRAKKRPRLTETRSGRSIIQTLEAQVEMVSDGYETDPLNLRPGEKWEDGTDGTDGTDQTDEADEGVDENDPFKATPGRQSQARTIKTAGNSAAVTPRGGEEKSRTVKSTQTPNTESMRTQPLHNSLPHTANPQNGKPATSILAAPSSRNLRYRLLRNGRMVVRLPGKTPSCSSSSPTPHSTDESITASASPSTSPSPAPPHKVRVTEAIAGIRLIPVPIRRHRRKSRAMTNGHREYGAIRAEARVHGFVDDQAGEEGEEGKEGSNPSDEYTTSDSGNEGEDVGEEIEEWSSSAMSEAEVHAPDSRCSLSTVMEEEEEEGDGNGANAGRGHFQLPKGWDEAMAVGSNEPCGENKTNGANLNGDPPVRRHGSASYLERRSAFGDGFFDRVGGGEVGFAVWRDGY